MNMLDSQVQEMKSMSKAIRKLEGIKRLLCFKQVDVLIFLPTETTIMFFVCHFGKYFVSWFGAIAIT